jgi:hypothetical protein
MPNKYQEEAALLAGDLGGTKWEKKVGPVSSRRPGRATFASYAEKKPFSAVLFAAAAAFVFGALWGVRRR